MPPAKKAKHSPQPFELRYFPVMAKGLGPALVAEYSGLPWKGREALGFDAGKDWKTLKPTTPFGQMPLLTTADGEMIAQTTAILNWIGKTSAIEGDGREYAVSQMLLAEAEDIYALTQKCVPTINVKVDAKGGMEMYDEFWKSKLPAHLDHLDKLCAAGSGFGDTPGSLYLFSMLFQLALIRADVFVAREGKQPGALAAWYTKTLHAKTTQKVLKGESSAGSFVQYFVPP